LTLTFDTAIDGSVPGLCWL